MSESERETRPCVVCGTPLTSASGRDDWETMQPSGGCELRIVGAYGSGKYDLAPGWTEYRGAVCDACATKLIGNGMRGPNCYGFQGELMDPDNPYIRRLPEEREEADDA